MTPPDAPDRFADFLKAEYAHVAASLLQNEEDGEKRVSTFIGIATARTSRAPQPVQPHDA
jgi:hypothetical protein